MKYLSICAGIEAASVAWHHMGWEPVAFSEIEAFPSAVLAQHYPNTPNWGDMTKYQEWPDANVDVLVGGTPCQSFSVAGLRKGLADPRGNLMLTFGAIAAKYRPRWLVWENVPGVLSSNGGRDFGTFLGMLGELGYGFAYRVLDAQFFGVAQRRRRVFVVGCLGDWQRAAAVLFERHSLSGHPAPSRETGKAVAAGAVPSIAGSLDTQCGGEKLTHQSMTNGHVIGTITARMFNSLGARDVEEGALLPVTFGARMSVPQTDVDMVQTLQATNPMAVAQPVALQDVREINKAQNGRGWNDDGTAYTVDTHATQGVAVAQPVAWDEELNARADLAGAMLRGGDGGRHDGVMTAAMQVRRLTPVECERLQGFPDGYTAIPWRNKPANQCPDGPRYKALGNSMAVPVMRWIGERIQTVENIK